MLCLQLHQDKSHKIIKRGRGEGKIVSIFAVFFTTRFIFSDIWLGVSPRGEKGLAIVCIFPRISIWSMIQGDGGCCWWLWAGVEYVLCSWGASGSKGVISRGLAAGSSSLSYGVILIRERNTVISSWSVLKADLASFFLNYLFVTYRLCNFLAQFRFSLTLIF